MTILSRSPDYYPQADNVASLDTDRRSITIGLLHVMRHSLLYFVKRRISAHNLGSSFQHFKRIFGTDTSFQGYDWSNRKSRYGCPYHDRSIPCLTVGRRQSRPPVQVSSKCAPDLL
ncbi:hypothetical protein TNCV_736811 [Trichonephila clavipes]|nr:hypothetical protein TNCV_736811 [Trichonephila clavipes]